MRIALLGPTGQLGTEMLLKFPQSEPLFRSQLDLTNPGLVRKKLAGKYFDVIINCAGITDLAYCEAHPAEAHAVHELATKELVNHCATHNIRYVHISDSLAVEPINVYGRSKAAGEAAILDKWLQNSIILRTTSMFGPALGRTNWIEKTIASARRVKSEIKIPSWRIISPTSARTVASALEDLLKASGGGGIYNIVDEGEPVTQAEAARFIIDSIPFFSHLAVKPQDRPNKAATPVRADTSLFPDLRARTSWRVAVREYLLEKGYLRPLCVREIELQADDSVTGVWNRLRRDSVPLEALVAALREDRANWLIGGAGPGRKAKSKKMQSFLEQYSAPEDDDDSDVSIVA